MRTTTAFEGEAFDEFVRAWAAYTDNRTVTSARSGDDHGSWEESSSFATSEPLDDASRRGRGRRSVQRVRRRT
jgi:hypothetical protein